MMHRLRSIDMPFTRAMPGNNMSAAFNGVADRVDKIEELHYGKLVHISFPEGNQPEFLCGSNDKEYTSMAIAVAKL